MHAYCLVELDISVTWTEAFVVTVFVENSLVFIVNNGWLRPDVSARHQVSVFTPLMLQHVA